ncbi:MAG: PKD domain-containing protein, partial [Gemmatimonadaceae bacterium]|nr:PKD domain-containing protein [Gemmatimonadaceae bacterium]
MMAGMLQWGCRLILVLALATTAAASPWTEGNKRLLCIRVDFSDHPGGPCTDAQAQDCFRRLEEFYRENSFGRFSVTTTVTPVLRMPKTDQHYYKGLHGSGGQEIIQDARKAAKQRGFDTDPYEFEIVTWNSKGPGAGIGAIGGKGLRLVNGFGYGGARHELGHNLGLPHTHWWETFDGSIAGPGKWRDYGDPCDPMGAGGDGRTDHFSLRSKVLLNWITESQITKVDKSGTYRIYPQDTDGVPGDASRGLRIVRDRKIIYWVELRQRITNDVRVMNGVRVHRSYTDNNELALMDMTPLSQRGAHDAPLLLGQTFSDEEAGIHITPIGKNGTSPESVDVVVQLGKFARNGKPTMKPIGLSAEMADRRTFGFGCDATDPDGDPLACAWDFGDGTFDWRPAVTHRFEQEGRDFVVQCVATDMKGKTVTRSVMVSPGNAAAKPSRLSGAVMGLDGKPVEAARVWTDDQHVTVSDVEGRFTLANLKARGPMNVNAQKVGMLFLPLRVAKVSNAPATIREYPVQLDGGVKSEAGIILRDGARLTTPRLFKPPVEITIVSQTDSTN